MFDENNPFREPQNWPKVNPKVKIFPGFRICSNRCEHDGSYWMNMCDTENRTNIFLVFYPALILCLSFKTQNFAVHPDISGFPWVPTCTTLCPCYPFSSGRIGFSNVVILHCFWLVSFLLLLLYYKRLLLLWLLLLLLLLLYSGVYGNPNINFSKDP